MSDVYRIVLNGGDADMVRLERADMPQELVHAGTTYTLRRDEHGEPSRDIAGQYRYFWLWPRPDVDPAVHTGHTTTGLGTA